MEEVEALQLALALMFVLWVRQVYHHSQLIALVQKTRIVSKPSSLMERVATTEESATFTKEE